MSDGVSPGEAEKWRAAADWRFKWGRIGTAVGLLGICIAATWAYVDLRPFTPVPDPLANPFVAMFTYPPFMVASISAPILMMSVAFLATSPAMHAGERYSLLHEEE